MRKLFIICALLFCLGTASAQQKFSVASPDGKLKLVLDIAPEKVAYSVKYGKQQLLEDSRLGFEFDSGEFGAGLIAGGLVEDKSQVGAILKRGVLGVSTSTRSLW